jgi:nitrite reductase (NADH) small subunit
VNTTPCFVDVAAFADVPRQSGLRIRHEGREIALFRDGDTVLAFDGACPHRGAPLGDASVESNVIACPLHGWRFSLPDGTCLDNPDKSLRRLPSRVVGPRIEIAL